MVTSQEKEKVKTLIERLGGFDNFLKYCSSNQITTQEKDNLEGILFFNGSFSIMAAFYYAS